jgi:hypothetical protein
MTAQRAIQKHIAISHWDYILNGLVRGPVEPLPWIQRSSPSLIGSMPLV